MRETRLSGLEGGAGFNPRFLPLSRIQLRKGGGYGFNLRLRNG